MIKVTCTWTELEATQVLPAWSTQVFVQSMLEKHAVPQGHLLQSQRLRVQVAEPRGCSKDTPPRKGLRCGLEKHPEPPGFV